ncbi:hypothetical protein NUM3379_28020 [Kineococcus sp. NUM-3379]
MHGGAGEVAQAQVRAHPVAHVPVPFQQEVRPGTRGHHPADDVGVEGLGEADVQDLQGLTGDGEHPLREDPGVPVEEAGVRPLREIADFAVRAVPVPRGPA